MLRCAARDVLIKGQAGAIVAKYTLDAQRAYMVKVVAVYVRIYAEQATDDRPHGVSEISGKRNAYGHGR